jgi:pimeloyl-ACP methyl ester carboxylesterase
MRDLVSAAAEAVGRKFKFRTVEGFGRVPIHMGEAGPADAPPVILIHGLGSSSLAWLPQLTSDLTDSLRVIVYDLRGHGASAKPWTADSYARPHTTAGDLRAVAAAAGVQRFTAVAWSYGGHVVVDYIRSFGCDTVAKINLVGTLAALVERPQTGATNLEALKASQARSVSDNPLEVMQANFGQADFITHKNVTAEMQALVEMQTNQLPTYAKRMLIGKITQNDDLVPKLTCPMLVSVGDDDFTVPKVSVETLMSRLPAGRLSTYTGCGHSPFLEEPARFNAELRGFVLGA